MLDESAVGMFVQGRLRDFVVVLRHETVNLELRPRGHAGSTRERGLAGRALFNGITLIATQTSADRRFARGTERAFYRSMRWVAIAGLTIGCGSSVVTAPPDAGNDPPPCVISASASRLGVVRGGTSTLTLSASNGDCEIQRVRLDREVFQIRTEPTWPDVIPGGTDRRFLIDHNPTVMLPRGQPVRELEFHGDGFDVLVVLEGEAPRGACLSITPEEIVFDGVGVGTTATEGVGIKNDCDEALELTQARIKEGGHSFSLRQINLPSQIPPRATLQVGVQYTPIASFPVAGVLELETTDVQTGRVEIEMIGFPQAPQILVLPSELNLGSAVERASACGTAPGVVQIANGGTQPLTVSAIQLGNNAFSFVQAPTVPFMVMPGAVSSMELRFHSAATGVAQGSLTFQHDGGPDAVQVELTAQGVTEAVNDVFDLPMLPKADLIFVVDDSQSLMFAAANVSQFTDTLLAALEGTDNRVAVASTGDGSGEFDMCNGNQAVLRSEASTLAARQEALQCVFNKRRFPSQRSAGIGAAIRAVNDNLGGTLIRDDAALAVIIISARDDTSGLADSAARSFFARIPGRSRPDGVRVYSIAPSLTAPCGAAPGVAYQTLALATGGGSFDLCDDDWGGRASSIATTLRERRTTFALSAKADPATFAITSDGVLVTDNDFSYDAVANVVTLDNAPANGTRVEIAYTATCEP